MGAVVDMTGRVLEPGETVTETAGQQAARAKFDRVWHSAPDIAREIADREGLFYPHVVEMIVHSLLQEAAQASEKHEDAASVLEFIGSCFYSDDDDSDSSESS